MVFLFYIGFEFVYDLLYSVGCIVGVNCVFIEWMDKLMNEIFYVYYIKFII